MQEKQRALYKAAVESYSLDTGELYSWGYNNHYNSLQVDPANSNTVKKVRGHNLEIVMLCSNVCIAYCVISIPKR